MTTNVGEVAHRVIGLVGASGCGKTTLAKHLVESHGFLNIHMGRPLKDMLIALGLSEDDVAGTPEQRSRPLPLLGGKSARYALSTLGTDWGRNMITPDLWVNATKIRIERKLNENQSIRIVVDDLRFPNDWAVIKQLGGVILTIRRPNIEPQRTIFDVVYHKLGIKRTIGPHGVLGWHPLHETEYHWRDAPKFAEVWNNGTIDEFLSRVSPYIF